MGKKVKEIINESVFEETYGMDLGFAFNAWFIGPVAVGVGLE